MASANEATAADKSPRTAAQDFHEVGNMAQEKVEQVRSGAADCAQEGRAAECSLEQYIRRQPLKSVLIAAGVGLVFGRFWLRR